MRKFKYINIILFLIFLFSNPDSALAKEKDTKNNRRQFNKTAQNPAQSVININNITCWVGADGYHDWVVASSYNGAYPKGTSVGSIFAEGMVWGGQINDGQTPVIRVNGNTYGSGCLSVFDEPRVFRVRPDFQDGNLIDDAASFNDVALGSVSEGMINELRAQYETDWLEWPADEGAPYFDADSNGVYEPDPNGNGIYGEDGEDIPGIPGASQTLYIKYTDALSSTLYASPPIGLEIQETYWAYAYTGALGNVIYKKVNLVYTGTPQSSPNSTINDFYFLQWSDPDVGSATDDFMGSDTTLNLGYAYNSTTDDATYRAIGLAPAAIGYDYLQGVSQYTGNQNDSAIFNLQWKKGYKYVNEKPMSSCVYFAAGGNWSDPDFNYQGTIEFYNYMRGKLPSGDDFPEAVADIVPGIGTFLLAGDPVARTGKIDGNATGGGDAPGDRRLLVMNGPFDLQLGDTAEVVIAMVGGLGTSNLNSVEVMKSNDRTAQIVFDQLFELPSLPPPDVSVVELDNKIILNWGGNSSSVSRIENFSSQGYDFEGYEIYQLPSSSSTLEDGVKLATFDVINGITTIVDTVEESGVLLNVISATGTDNGIQRYFEITRDPFRGNQPLRNGQEYYLAVVAYAFNPAPLLPFHALRSNVVLKVGVPQSPEPGVRYASAVGDTISEVTHTPATGGGDGSVIPVVVDPTSTTGHTYKVTFQENEGETTWSLTNTTTGEVKMSNQTNQTGNEDYQIADGILVKVLGPPLGVKQISELDANDEVVDPNVGLIPLSLGSTGYFISNVAGAANDGDRTFDRFHYWGTDDVIIDFSETSLSWDYITEEVHIDQATNQPNYVPYAVYRRKFPSGEIVRLFAGFYDTDSNGVWSVDLEEPLTHAPGYERIFAWQGYDADGNEIQYDPANDAQYIADNSLSVSANTTFGDAAGEFDYPYLTETIVTMYSDGATIPEGNKIVFTTNKTNSPQDEYTFTAPAPSSTNADLAKGDVDKINVFPNPYYGFHYRENSRDDKYVTFSHLPNKAVIRIFDLSGVLVRTLPPKDPNAQFTTWDLKNNDNYPVASGIYIVHIDMPDLGVTKILKLAVVQEEQILKVY